MTDDLVKQLRWLGDHASFEPHMHHVAADRIEKLEAALRELSCKCVSNCDWERGDICFSWIARKALEGKDD
jgi:hypothetical protein